MKTILHAIRVYCRAFRIKNIRMVRTGNYVTLGSSYAI